MGALSHGGRGGAGLVSSVALFPLPLPLPLQFSFSGLIIRAGYIIVHDITIPRLGIGRVVVNLWTCSAFQLFHFTNET